MERLLQLALSRIIRLAMAFCFTMFAQEFCSLRVLVHDTKGAPITAKVAVMERSGKITHAVAQDGRAEFCNLGLFPITLTVGAGGCAEITVRNVPLTWAKSAEFSVEYDNRLCGLDETPPVAACRFLLKFVDETGEPVAGVVVEEASPIQKDSRSDGFGRVLIRIVAGAKFIAIGRVNGFSPVSLEIPCIRDNGSIERVIPLRKSAP